MSIKNKNKNKIKKRIMQVDQGVWGGGGMREGEWGGGEWGGGEWGEGVHVTAIFVRA